MSKRYWLFKSEPSSFSISDLEKAGAKGICWDGVRNYQARNFLSKEIAKGDEVFFYHSNSQPSAIVGVALVIKSGYPDPSAFDPKSQYYDEKSKKNEPTWYSVDIRHVKTFKHPITLTSLKQNAKLQEMTLLKKGSRLSIQPVRAAEWNEITNMSEQS